MSTSDKHDWTLAEIHRALNTQGSLVNQSTVYRGLLSLQRAQRIRQLATLANEYHFELEGSHHDHVLCSSCGTLQETSCVSPAGDIPQEINGFQILDHQLTLAGICGRCRDTRS